MSKKFTEKQYQVMVNVSDEYQDKTVYGIIGGGAAKTIGSELYETTLSLEIDFYAEAKEIMAIANPLTREWAHEQYVEREPVFHFTLKDARDSNDGQYHLVKNGKGAIILYPFGGADKPTFKESEIREWGFNPEMFDKEELK